MSTVSVQRWIAPRPDHRNRATVLALPAIVVPRDMRSLFVRAYPAIAASCRAIDEPGVAVVAVDEATGAPCGLALVRARIGRHTAIVIGRHDRCDLFLDGNGGLALRHLALVLDPVRSFEHGATVRYRVLDLRTTQGFADEHGRPLRGLSAEGPTILRAAGHVLFVLPLGDPTDWPAAGPDAWDMLPERVYVTAELPAMQQRSMHRMSLMLQIPGPRDTSMNLAEHGVAGVLEIDRRARIPVGAEALRDGVLLGRYTRCDAASWIDDELLSRVHLLLLDADGTLLAIDTASMHGVRVGDQLPRRIVALPERAELALGARTRIVFRRS